MAFFGLTQLGPQSNFHAVLLDSMDLTLFSEEEFRRAFSKLDKDGSGFIEIGEFESLLEDLYKGPAPESQVKAVMATFDSNKDGRVSWDEFREGVLKLQAEQDSKEAPRAVTYSSGEALRATRRKHTREREGPRDTFAVPLTTSQETGWLQEKPVGHSTRPKIKCEETKYADELLRSGVYY